VAAGKVHASAWRKDAFLRRRFRGAFDITITGKSREYSSGWRRKMKAILLAALALSIGVGAGVANAQSLSHMAPPQYSRSN
jgi:hypothetical protein